MSHKTVHISEDGVFRFTFLEITAYAANYKDILYSVPNGIASFFKERVGRLPTSLQKCCHEENKTTKVHSLCKTRRGLRSMNDQAEGTEY